MPDPDQPSGDPPETVSASVGDDWETIRAEMKGHVAANTAYLAEMRAERDAEKAERQAEKGAAAAAKAAAEVDRKRPAAPAPAPKPAPPKPEDPPVTRRRGWFDR